SLRCQGARAGRNGASGRARGHERQRNKPEHTDRSRRPWTLNEPAAQDRNAASRCHGCRSRQITARGVSLPWRSRAAGRCLRTGHYNRGVDPALAVVGGFPLYTFAVLLDAGVAVALALTAYLTRRRRLPLTRILDAAIVTLFAALVGARLAYVLLHWSDYAANP